MSHDRDRDLVPLLSSSELGRRDALKLVTMGIAAAQAACLRAPGEEIRPYVAMPPEMHPGRAERYATAMVIDGYATGLVVEAHEGRPTKIEGNVAHPMSLGATNAQHQAAVYDLYDPHRAKSVHEAGAISSWDRLYSALEAPPPGPMWMVLGPQSSPLIGDQLALLHQQRRDLHVVYYAPLDGRAAYRGAQLAYGRPLQTQLDLAHADVVVALDADVLDGMPMSLRWARDFSERRRVLGVSDTQNRLYVFEPMLTGTGTLADHRFALAASDVSAVAIALLREIARRARTTPMVSARSLEQASARVEELGCAELVRALASDLAAHQGASAVIVGDRQPPACHALGHLINAALGNLGRTVKLTEPVLQDPLAGESLSDLAAALRAGQVGSVLVLESNPVYSAPPELELARLLPLAPLTVHLSLFRNETSRVCRFAAPASHFLESWGDARAWDGTASFIQPLARPLYDTRSVPELLAAIAGMRHAAPRELVREPWRAPLSGTGDFESAFERALSSGIVEGSAFPAVRAEIAVQPDLVAELARALPERTGRSLELNLARSPALHDGSFANNGWLEELPHPVTKLTWNNAAMLGPVTARRLGAEDGDVLALRAGERALEVAAIVVQGHAEGVMTLELGYGRSNSEEALANGVGVNAYTLMSAPGTMIRSDLSAITTGEKRRLARTQHQFSDEGRNIARAMSLSAFYERARKGEQEQHKPPSLLRERKAKAPQWAMTIDTSACTGCGACVVACQAENNIPVVGPSDVARGREMHWLRIDRYHAFDEQTQRLEVVSQPMLCQHCEHAPCEYVCPVFATEHSPDGLNEMVYNRCVGTRFCSNNCPYKVRRFNWFNYTADDETLALQKNPNVTVRDRGVMEKCTFCVQRIRSAEIASRIDKRSIRAGEVQTACAQACATRAIQFGALEHADTDMVRWRASPRRYTVLEELNTKPRVVYLEKLYNPNPELGRAT